MYVIKDKVAIVTGGAGGIGKATVEAILEKGGLPVIADWNVEMGEATAGELGVPFIQTDVSNEEQVKSMVDFAVEKYGRLDIIVNNAGISPAKMFHEYTTEEYRHIIGVNQDGVYFGCKYAINQMLKQGDGGCIVNVSSMMGIIGAPNAPIYCMTKGAVRNFTKALALGYAKENIRVNSMHPGDIETGLIDKNVLGQETIDTLSALIPLGRLGTSEEIAHGIIFMIENEYLTGAEILIDGGYVIQ